MKSVKFWRLAAKELSLTEQIFFIDAIKRLFEWQTLKRDYPELNLIKRILESESGIITPAASDDERKRSDNDLNPRLLA